MFLANEGSPVQLQTKIPFGVTSGGESGVKLWLSVTTESCSFSPLTFTNLASHTALSEQFSFPVGSMKSYLWLARMKDNFTPRFKEQSFDKYPLTQIWDTF